jgi:hypothetical protein
MRKTSMTLVFASAAMFAACSDNSVSPRDQASDSDMAVVGGVSTSLTGSDTVRFDIVIDPSRVSTYHLGAGNSLVFPTGSVCDPSKSSYGDGEWDKPCTAARSLVTEHVKAWLDAQGHPRADFSPDLRFVPSALPTQWVNISFADFQASLDPMFAILYCKQEKGKGSCTDESKKDPTLLTVRNAVTGKVTRRIKHFSGYMVGAGDDSSGAAPMNKIGGGSTLPFKLPTIEPAAAVNGRKTRTGYMLASGRQDQ